jgi:hypothetical protein
MERTQLLDLMGELKLHGMKAAFDEICGFRRKAASDSDASRPPIPTEGGHRFRSKPATPCRV